LRFAAQLRTLIARAAAHFLLRRLIWRVMTG
jgi:hypothetical protein